MKRSGFTLIELVITVTLLVVIMGLAIPNVIRMVSRNREAQLERTHEIVCEAARVFAYRRGSCAEFGFETGNERVRIINANCVLVNNITQPVSFLVEQELLSNTLTDPVRNNERYNYNMRIVYGRSGNNLTITLRYNNNNIHSCS